MSNKISYLFVKTENNLAVNKYQVQRAKYYTNDQLASRLGISVEELEESLEKHRTTI